MLSNIQVNYRMHDTDAMAAVHGGPHLPVPHQVHNFPATILKKNYEPYVQDVDNYEDDFDDDDDFSDHDSHYSEDLPDDLDPQQIVQKVPDITKQLLDFTEMVNADIKKFFGRNKNEEDACDIYEDKWMPTKSGRELYYADLLRVAQGDSDLSKPSKDSTSPLSPKDDLDNRHQFSGRLDKKVGLGPLNELFDFGLRPSIIERDHKFKRLKRVKLDDQKQTDIVPMHDRSFPVSFWKEPGSDKQSDHPKVETSAPGILNSSKPPDFSDLLQSWTGGQGEFPEEMSSEGSMDSSGATVIQNL